MLTMSPIENHWDIFFHLKMELSLEMPYFFSKCILYKKKKQKKNCCNPLKNIVLLCDLTIKQCSVIYDSSGGWYPTLKTMAVGNALIMLCTMPTLWGLAQYIILRHGYAG